MKAGGDSELVYASLYAYDTQLEKGLTQETAIIIIWLLFVVVVVVVK